MFPTYRAAAKCVNPASINAFRSIPGKRNFPLDSHFPSNWTNKFSKRTGNGFTWNRPNLKTKRILHFLIELELFLSVLYVFFSQDEFDRHSRVTKGSRFHELPKKTLTIEHRIIESNNKIKWHISVDRASNAKQTYIWNIIWKLIFDRLQTQILLKPIW